MFIKIYEGLYTDLMTKVLTLKKAGISESEVQIHESKRPCWWELHVAEARQETAEAALGLLHLPEEK